VPRADTNSLIFQAEAEELEFRTAFRDHTRRMKQVA